MADVTKETKQPKVTGVFFKEGGLEMGSQGTQNSLPRNIKGVELELATHLGGLIVRFPNRQTDGTLEQETLLVPMSHIRGIKLG
jgi:hypothetical protein